MLKTIRMTHERFAGQGDREAIMITARSYGQPLKKLAAEGDVDAAL